MDQRDLERIARSVLKELGLADRGMTLEPDARPDLWRLTVSGHPSVIVKCGRGTTAQFVRNQIFEQLQSR